MLGAGMNLETVTRRLGYQSQEWVFKLASPPRRLPGDRRAGQGPGPPPARTVMATLRYRLAKHRA